MSVANSLGLWMSLRMRGYDTLRTSYASSCDTPMYDEALCRREVGGNWPFLIEHRSTTAGFAMPGGFHYVRLSKIKPDTLSCPASEPIHYGSSICFRTACSWRS